MKRTIGFVLASAVALAAFAIGWSAHAGASTASAATPMSMAASSRTFSPQQAKQRYDAFVADVATQAGISSSTLDQAIRTVAVQRVQTAESAGLIKSATATKIEQAITDGNLSTIVRQRIAAARADGVKHPLAHLMRHHRQLRHHRHLAR